MEPQKAAQHPEMLDSGTFKTLNVYRVQTIVTWSMFPMVWTLSFTGLFS